MTSRFPIACVVALLAASPAHADDPPRLPGTRPLALRGDIASLMVDGADHFLLRKTAESVARREAIWRREFADPANKGVATKASLERLARMLGVRDDLAPTAPPAEFGDDRDVGGSATVRVVAFRRLAFGDVTVEGLILTPRGRPPVGRAVIVIPDADQTPEQLAGLAPGVPAESRVAQRLAESGVTVYVPALIDRRVEPRNARARLTTREFLNRPAFELGRHLIGYEVQKVRAIVALHTGTSSRNGAEVVESPFRNVAVFGYGEGGRIALYAAALDPKVLAVAVSGAFGPRESTWREPIDRNVFGLLETLGDAEVACLIAPRPVIVEAAKGPEVVVKPGDGGAPGRLVTPALKGVSDEVARASRLDPRANLELVVSGEGAGPFGTDRTLRALLRALEIDPNSWKPAGPAPHARGGDDTEARRLRQIHEIDRHNQQLLVESPYARQAYFAGLDTASPASFAKTIEPYRDTFRDDVIGRFDDPLLPPDVRSRKVYDEPTVEGYEVVMDVFPDVIAYGILLVPKGIKAGERRPVVVCQHGLEGRPQDLADPKVDSPYYHRFAFKLAERGFVTFAPQNLYLFRDRFRTLQRKANPLKKTLFSVIVPQHQQMTDWLKTLPFVDPARIGFYGLSYGGKSAMRIPPLVPNYCLSICSADFNDWVWKNASTRSPYSYVWSEEYEIFEFGLGETFNYAEMAALIAPRPFMVERGHFDGVAPDETVGSEFAKVRFLYEAKLGLADRCAIEWFTGPHTIRGVGTFDFLHKHLDWPKP